MSTIPNCPECQSEYAYEMDGLWNCPECGHTWSGNQKDTEVPITVDANGTPLQDGDTVTVVKDLKVKGSSLVVKVGTKVKGIRLIEPVHGHDIDCKITGIGPMKLKSSVVKKV